MTTTTTKGRFDTILDMMWTLHYLHIVTNPVRWDGLIKLDITLPYDPYEYLHNGP
jgi:hypothetical protein